MIRPLRAANLTGLEGVAHGFFTREGGQSAGIYASLNCGPGSADRPAAIVENRAHAMASLGLDASALVTAFQVHGCDVTTITHPTDIPPKVDGMVTRVPEIALGILTADCAPVLFADAEAGIIGAAHAGWKGALAGILDQTVAAMVALGARRANIAAAVGPCIGRKSYEVGPEFRDLFLDAEPASAAFFIENESGGRPRFDLGGYAENRLRGLGIGTLSGLGLDTCEDGRFFSYRRSVHRREPDYGRQLSAICLHSTKD